MATRPRHRYRHVRVSRESRTKLLSDQSPVHKGDVDGGKYYRCWNCGQICNDRYHELGGADSGSGATYSDFAVDSQGRSAVILRTIPNGLVSGKLDSDGNDKPVVHNYSTSGSGCPLCHSLNWRGDYP